jgi:Txe/YoeB family toxin of Txe-Axe toxin-antitoxin module
MTTHCTTKQLTFQGIETRAVVAAFDGGQISSDGGSLLLREIEHGREYIREFARCFRDDRDQRFVEHSVERLIAQRTYGLCLGYEDLVDHEELRDDPMMGLLCGKADEGPLAGKSTLNRLETAKEPGKELTRYKKIVADMEKLSEFFVATFVRTTKHRPVRLILDFDATDDPLHGNQEGRFFHGYYDCYCYLPLYVFCGDQLLWAQLRRSDIDASDGALEVLQTIVRLLRQKWPGVSILVRGDSGFCREELMSWCEDNRVDYLFGIAKNARLLKHIRPLMKKVRRSWARTGKATRRYMELRYRTLNSWSRSRRVIAKAEYLDKGENPRFVVTSLSRSRYLMREVYEDLYCLRGDMENRIKEQQLYLFADRTSSATMRANQLRLWFSSLAYVFLNELRRVGLKATELATATCQTIRLKVLKIGALMRRSVRRLTVSLAGGYPYQDIFATAAGNLQRAYRLRC